MEINNSSYKNLFLLGFKLFPLFVIIFKTTRECDRLSCLSQRMKSYIVPLLFLPYVRICFVNLNKLVVDHFPYLVS